MRTVVITGVSNGIGFCLAEYFLRHNHKVIGLSRTKGEAIHISNKDFHFIQTDLSKEPELKAAIDTIYTITSEVDILINNAGALINKPFAELSGDDFRQIFEINTIAPANLIRNLLPLLQESKTLAHIINIGSMGGVQGSIKFPGLSAYSTSKAAIANLTECLAEELKETNIRINCLALGSVNTKMLKKAFPDYEAQTNPSEIADFIGQFALNNAKYINGKIIPVTINTP